MTGGCEDGMKCDVWVRNLYKPISWFEALTKTVMTNGVKKRL